jgi:2-dehydro-3-deoxyphosphogluconate aldolase/(4S)-4-hydroxy-2-oxoglutarate aldolase
MIMSDNIYEKIHKLGVVPVIAINSVESALPLADALIEGGLPIAEITFRTKAASQVISLLSQKRPELIIGAGTILNIDDLKRAKDCGAGFAVAPGLNSSICQKSLEIGLPFSPGVMTPTDIEAAIAIGIKNLKFFPAEAAGGVNMLKSLYAPYKHLGIKFIPTGGIKTSNVQDYLALDAVLAVGGTWIAATDDIASSNWAKIKANCISTKALLSPNMN